MIFSSTSVGGTYEILASNDFQAVPLAITEEELVKAGMPIKNDGTKAEDGSGAIGILLYDVDPKVNPNGAVVVDGIIDWDKAKNHSGATAEASAISAALPNIVFRDKTGKTYAGTAAV